MKSKCYSCKWRKNVPGSAHSSCGHPSIDKSENVLMSVLTLMQATGRTGGVVSPKELNIKANETGVNGGWFMFPFDFDPVWLDNCDGYTKKDKE